MGSNLFRVDELFQIIRTDSSLLNSFKSLEFFHATCSLQVTQFFRVYYFFMNFLELFEFFQVTRIFSSHSSLPNYSNFCKFLTFFRVTQISSSYLRIISRYLNFLELLEFSHVNRISSGYLNFLTLLEFSRVTRIFPRYSNFLKLPVSSRLLKSSLPIYSNFPELLEFSQTIRIFPSYQNFPELLVLFHVTLELLEFYRITQIFLFPVNIRLLEI